MRCYDPAYITAVLTRTAPNLLIPSNSRSHSSPLPGTPLPHSHAPRRYSLLEKPDTARFLAEFPWQVRSEQAREAERETWGTGVPIPAKFLFDPPPSNPFTLTPLSIRHPQVLVLDEAHGLKNAGSQRFKHVMDLPSRTRVLLTGTPVQNNVNELVSLLR